MHSYHVSNTHQEPIIIPNLSGGHSIFDYNHTYSSHMLHDMEPMGTDTTDYTVQAGDNILDINNLSGFTNNEEQAQGSSSNSKIAENEGFAELVEDFQVHNTITQTLNKRFSASDNPKVKEEQVEESINKGLGEVEQPAKKRLNYDVLRSFFRVFFRVDNQGFVLKDSIYNLYKLKIPQTYLVARNAVYRHMYSLFKEHKLTAFQNNYRDYIRGVQMNMSLDNLNYEGSAKDLAMLHSIGIGDCFDFSLSDVDKKENNNYNANNFKPEVKCETMSGVSCSDNSTKGVNNNDNNAITISNGALKVSSGGANNRKRDTAEDSDDDLLLLTNNIEGLANTILLEAQSIKASIMLRKQKKLAVELGFK